MELLDFKWPRDTADQWKSIYYQMMSSRFSYDLPLSLGVLPSVGPLVQRFFIYDALLTSCWIFSLAF